MIINHQLKSKECVLLAGGCQINEMKITIKGRLKIFKQNNYDFSNSRVLWTNKIFLTSVYIVYQCILLTLKLYWRKTKDKYKERRVYWTRYMTQYGIRHFFKNKGNLVFNYKLNKSIHLSKTPMKVYLQYIEVVKNWPIKDYKDE